ISPITTHQRKTQAKLLALRTKILKDIKKGTQEITDGATLMRTGLDNLVDVSADSIVSEIKRGQKNIITVLQKQKEDIVTSFADVGKKVGVEFQGSLEQVNSILDSTSGTMAVHTYEISNSIKKILLDLETHISSIMNSNTKLINDTVNEDSKQLISELDESIRENREHIQNILIDPVKSQFNNHTETLSNLTQEIQDILIKTIKAKEEEYTSNVIVFTDGVSRTAVEQSSLLTDLLLKTRTKSTRKSKATLTNIENAKSISERDVQKAVKNIQNQLQKAFSSQEVLLSRSIKHQLEHAKAIEKQSLAKTESTLFSSIKHSIEKIGSTKNATIATLLANFESINDLIQDYFLIIENSLTPLISQLLENQFKASGELTEVIGKQMDSTLNVENQLNHSIKESHSNTSKSLKKTTSRLQKTTTSEMKQAVYTIQEKGSQTDSNLQKILENSMIEQKDLSLSTYAKIRESIESFAAGKTSAVTMFEKDLVESFKTFEKDSNSQHSKSITQIGESFISVKKSSEKLITILNSSWEALQNRKSLHTLKTWIVASKKALEYYLGGVLQRTNSSLTLATPKFSDLPHSKIRGLPENIPIILITSAINPTNPETKKYLNKPNIRLFNRQKNDVYALLRDNEEMLFGYSTPMENEVFALVSRLPETITYFKNVSGPDIMQSSHEIKISKKKNP
ncbi:MAG: hypothetical protein ACW976_00175, partial [Candidatus Ranarchaeia archaeon]